MGKNILKDSVIRTIISGGATVQATLPEIYAALIRDDIDTFPALRPHQRHAWHAFLVQLGAMAIHRAGLNEPPDDVEDWRRILRSLTPDFPNDEPWHLVVEDITKPAFMQPPASSVDRQKDYESKKKRVDTPDKLDMLVTSKNHDLKSDVGVLAKVDDWLFALVALQTLSGSSGKGNYSISRIRSAYSGRPAFSLTPSTRPGNHFLRDVGILLSNRDSLLDEYQMTNDGIGLVWTVSWDGKDVEALPFNSLDPYYIEICRRIRLRFAETDQLYADRANSNALRINAKMLNGKTGDPWTPINVKEDRALNVGPGGFTYKRVSEYLTSPDWHWPTLLRPTPDEQYANKPMNLVARSLACNTRKQGMTEGYHERIIPFREKVIRAFGLPSGRQEVGDIARERIVQIGIVRNILRRAIATFAAHGNSDFKTHRSGNPSPNDLARPWAAQLDAIVDGSFFADLQVEFEADINGERQHIRNEWLRDSVIAEASTVLRSAQNSLPCPAIQRYRAFAAATVFFERQIFKELSFLFDKTEED